MQSPRTGLGQAQYWFYFQTGDVEVPLTRLPPGEFRAARWVNLAHAVVVTAAFRRPVYEELHRFSRRIWR
jgi:hypothetical protein